MLNISDDTGIPLYQRIVTAVCEEITSGRLAPGQKLPPRTALAKSLGISPVTVSRSYELLQQRGIIRQKRGSGTYVQPGAIDQLQKAADLGRPFRSIVMVVGEPSLEQCPRDRREIITDIMLGVDDALQENVGRFVFVESFSRACLDGLTEGSVVLLVCPRHVEPAMFDVLTQRGVVVLGLWTSDLEIAVPRIAFDPHQAASLACQHLIDCGYRRLGFIGEMGHSALLGAKFFEFTNVLFRAGLDFQVQHVREVRSHTPGAAFEAILSMAQTGDLPEAFLVGADYNAMEVMRALKYIGRRVPEDVGVVGYGDIPEAAHCVPPLTTVRLPRRRIGQRAGRLLAERATPPSPQRFVLDSELIVRNSTTMPKHLTDREAARTEVSYSPSE